MANWSRMNNGLNSFLISISADINSLTKENPHEKTDYKYKNTVDNYLEMRTGMGENAFAIAFNDRKNVYRFSGEYGSVYNNTFKIGLDFYYHFYEHYYNYIRKHESLTQAGRQFEHYQINLWHNATNLGLSLNGEILLNHFGIEMQVGFNFHKPSYKIDWRINKGWKNTPQDIPESWQIGELDSYFKLKYRISSRLGLIYYFFGMESKPENNFYEGAHINANLG